MDYFATGAPLAEDTAADPDTTQVDALAQPAQVTVSAAEVPAGAQVVAAYLYWGGTVPDQGDCATTIYLDTEVLLTLPGAAAPGPVQADVCHCVAGAPSYDIQACRVDVTAQVSVSGMLGTFSVEGFAARAANGATDNASFSLVFVYEDPASLPPRRIALYDGLEELYLTSRAITLSGLDVDSPARGEITWYVLDGDVGGQGPESVSVQGLPGGLAHLVSDGLNPPDNPMNRTINTTVPPQSGTIGVDVDRLDIGPALTPGDTSLNMVYTAGGDKYWVVYNLVGVNVYRAVVHPKEARKGWTLLGDADGNGVPSPGDTVRYTIHLENVGTAPGFVTIRDPMPPELVPFQVVYAAGGLDRSTATDLWVEDIWIQPGGVIEVVFDAVIAPGTAGRIVVNVAQYDTGDDQGEIVGEALQIRPSGGGAADAGVDAGAGDAGPAGFDGRAPDARPASDGADDPPDSGAGAPAPPRGCGCGVGAGALPARAPLLFGLLVIGVLVCGRRRRGCRAGPRGCHGSGAP